MCGVGVVSVPASDVARVRERMTVSSAVQALQVPLSPRWLTGVTGARVDSPQLVGLDSGPLRMERGEARLLVRAWASPGEAESRPIDRSGKGNNALRALVQVQVAPQIVTDGPASTPTRRTPAELLSGSPGLAMDAEAGQVLTRLTLDAACDGSEAYIFYPLFGTAKEADRTTNTTPSTDTKADSPAAMPMKRAMGPETPEPLTLGEVMLSDALALRPRRERTILVVLPRPPAEYRLIE